MTMRHRIGIVGGTVLGCVLLLHAWGVAEEAKAAPAYLQKAYDSETQAKARDEAFAAKAEEEGYKAVAAMFRALAKSEGLHASGREAMIKKLGVEPKAAAADKLEVKSTRENLEAAVKAETVEKDALYPELSKLAAAAKDEHAVMAFKGAVAIATENIKICKKALQELETWKAADKEFIVCMVCGYVSMNKSLIKCPVCSALRSKFESVK
jgi:rubrerythrin